jgi:hypothetical protein
MFRIAIPMKRTAKRLEKDLWKYAGGEAKQFEGDVERDGSMGLLSVAPV